MKTYKICFIGASGHWGYVTEGMHHLENTVLGGFAPSHEGENLDVFKNIEFRGSKGRFYADYRKMLDEEQPQIVSVTPRYDLIAPISVEAARRGIHIIAEKPIALHLDALNRLRQTVDRAGIRLTAMFGIRYQPAFYTAKKLMQRHHIGEPLLISGQKSYKFGRQRPEWYKKRETYGSTINWVGIHTLDWARWLSGMEFTEVFGYHATKVHTDYGECQDISGLVARISNGGSAVFNFDYLRPETAVTHGDDRIRIAGSKGVLEVIGRENRLSVIDEQGEHSNWPLETPPGFLVDFINELEGGGKSIISQEDAFKSTEAAIRATEAADTGTIVKFD